MRILLVSDKPSVTSALLPHLLDAHPDLTQDGLTVAHLCSVVSLNACFAFPRRLRWVDLPYTGTPRYEPLTFPDPRVGPVRAWTGWRFREETDASGVPERWVGHGPTEVGPEHVRDAAASADLVVSALDDGPLDRLTFTKFAEWYGLDLTRVREVRLRDLHPSRAKAAYADARTWEHADADLSFARLKRHFDHAFTVNSRLILGRTMQDAGCAPDAHAPSKFQVQLLYHLARTGRTDEGRAIHAMSAWSGTGRYPVQRRHERHGVRFGTEASRAPIVRHLIESGLAAQDGRWISVSDLGRRFLDLLHPDCEDADLPFRMTEWCRMPEEEGRARIDRYVRTWFGRQMRFLARRHVPGAAARACE